MLVTGCLERANNNVKTTSVTACMVCKNNDHVFCICFWHVKTVIMFFAFTFGM